MQVCHWVWFVTVRVSVCVYVWYGTQASTRKLGKVSVSWQRESGERQGLEWTSGHCWATWPWVPRVPPPELLAPGGTLGVAYQGSLTVLLATGKERCRQPHEPLVG